MRAQRGQIIDSCGLSKTKVPLYRYILVTKFPLLARQWFCGCGCYRETHTHTHHDRRTFLFHLVQRKNVAKGSRRETAHSPVGCNNNKKKQLWAQWKYALERARDVIQLKDAYIRLFQAVVCALWGILYDKKQKLYNIYKLYLACHAKQTRSRRDPMRRALGETGNFKFLSFSERGFYNLLIYYLYV